MSATPLSDLKLQEYWTAHEAHRVLNIPEQEIRRAMADHSLRRHHFGSSTQKVNADEARKWAHSAPSREGGEWL